MQRLGKVLLFATVVVAVAGLSGCFVPPGPRADFTATPEFGFPPFDVVFNASGSSSPNGQIVTYAWSLGDGSTADGVTTTHRYTEKGIYEVTLEVRDSVGETAVRTKSVEALNRAPAARFTANVYATGLRQPVWFDASDSVDQDGEIVEYSWDFGDGETGDGVLVEHEYTSAHGSGWRPTITLTVVDEDGASDSITHDIIVTGCDACGS